MTNFACLNFKVMDFREKQEVMDHIVKVSTLPENSKGYQVIDQLFRIQEANFMFNEINIVLEMRRYLTAIGLEVELKGNRIILEDYAMKQYYEKVIGKIATPEPEKLSHYERVKNTK